MPGSAKHAVAGLPEDQLGLLSSHKNGVTAQPEKPNRGHVPTPARGVDGVTAQPEKRNGGHAHEPSSPGSTIPGDIEVSHSQKPVGAQSMLPPPVPEGRKGSGNRPCPSSPTPSATSSRVSSNSSKSKSSSVYDKYKDGTYWKKLIWIYLQQLYALMGFLKMEYPNIFQIWYAFIALGYSNFK